MIRPRPWLALLAALCASALAVPCAVAATGNDDPPVLPGNRGADQLERRGPSHWWNHGGDVDQRVAHRRTDGEHVAVTNRRGSAAGKRVVRTGSENGCH